MKGYVFGELFSNSYAEHDFIPMLVTISHNSAYLRHLDVDVCSMNNSVACKVRVKVTRCDAVV